MESLSKTILLVEDEYLIAKMEIMQLQKYGYNVIHAGSGEQAVEIFKENNSIDLILMDINLGRGIDGTEAAEIILKEKDIPVVFLSSHMEPEIVEKTEKITSYGYVVKNSTVTVLDASIKIAFKLFDANKKIMKSNNLLTNLAALVPGVIYQYRLYSDGKSSFPYSSPGMYDIYEVTPEEVREDATPVFGRLHPDDFDNVVRLINESALTLNTFYCEFRVILPQKGLRWRWSQANPERMEDGSTLWHGIISDITERKEKEEEINQYKTLLQAGIDSPKDLIIMAIDKNYEYLFFNKFHRETMQKSYRKNIEIGMNVLELISSEEDRKNAKNNYDLALKGKSHSTIQEYGDIQKAYYKSFYNPIKNDKNEIIGITVFARDITDRI